MPFKSKAQRRWMYANDPEMAERWEEHTPDVELPERVDEVRKATPEEEEELERLEAEAEAQEAAHLEGPDPVGDEPDRPTGDVISFDDAMDDILNGNIALEEIPEEEPAAEPEQDEYDPLSDILGSDEPAAETAAPAEPTPEPEKTIIPTIRKPAKRPKEYSKKNKGGDREKYAVDVSQLRGDLANYEEEIFDMVENGVEVIQRGKIVTKPGTSSNIARALNDKHDLRATPESYSQDRRGAPKTLDVKCPQCDGYMEKTSDSWDCPNTECNYTETRAFTPNQIAMFLKAAGVITRGEGSSDQDLGASLEHNHSLDIPWKEGCPACEWSTSTPDSDYGQEEADQATMAVLQNLAQEKGTFTTQDAIQAVGKMPAWETDIATPYFEDCPECGSSRRKKVRDNLVCRDCNYIFDIEKEATTGQHGYMLLKKRGFHGSKIPYNMSLGQYVVWTLSNNPEFVLISGEKRDGVWALADQEWSPWAVNKTRMRESSMHKGCDCSCASCEEGNHQRCSKNCGNPSLSEMFGESAMMGGSNIASMKKPGDEQLMASDFTDLKKNIDNVQKQIQGMKANTLQKPDGSMFVFPQHMGDDDMPLKVNLKQGTLDQQQGDIKKQGVMQQQGMPTMENIFNGRRRRG